MQRIILAYKGMLTFSFLLCINLISLSCLTALAMISNTILDRSGESGPSCVVPDFNENDSFSLFSMLLAVASI